MRPCPVCGKTESLAVGTLQNTYPNPLILSSYDLVKCPYCDVVYLSPLPPPEDLAKIYSESQFDYYTEDSIQTVLEFCSQRMRSMSQALGNPERLSVLEIGAGPAWLARAAKLCHPNAMTVAQDISSEMSQKCPWVDYYLVDSADSPELDQRGPYDVISLTHVIEHLPDPVAMLRRLKPICRGLIFITAPHRPEAWSGTIEEWTKYSYNHVPGHLQYFSGHGLQMAAQRAGLQVSHWDGTSENGQSFEAWLDSPWPVAEPVLQNADRHREAFLQADPFQHVMIDDFFEPDFAEELLEHFPSFDAKLAINEAGAVGGKAVNTKIREISPAYRRLYEAIMGKGFLDMASRVSGIPDLILDPKMFGGGTHENLHGQDLDVHVDFNYDEARQLHRRLNLILYLNKGWEPEWGGSIEIHSNPRDPEHNRVKSYAPLFNRAVMFETNEVSWHGFSRINLPPDRRHQSRKSISIYLYTKTRPAEEIAPMHGTFYIQRPLPGHLQAGATLTGNDIVELNALLFRRDKWIEIYHKMELTKNSEIGNLHRAVENLSKTVPMPLTGYALAGPESSGIFLDRWVCSKAQFQLRPLAPVHGILLRGWRPSNAAPGHVRISAGGVAAENAVGGDFFELALRFNRATTDVLDVKIEAESEGLPTDASLDDRDLQFSLIEIRTYHPRTHVVAKNTMWSPALKSSLKKWRA